MDLPFDVNTWTYETVLGVLGKRTREPYELDFKEVLGPDPKWGAQAADKHRSNIRKCACSLANADGGFIIFGISPDITLPPQERITGIPSNTDWGNEFGNLAKLIRPQLPFDFNTRPIELPANPKLCILIVSIPRSPRRPHELEGVFYRRGNGGSADIMSAFEVRDQMIHTEERFRKLELLRTEIAFIRQTHDHLKAESDENRRTYRFDTTGIRPLVAETCPLFGEDKKLEEGLLELTVLAHHVNTMLERLNEHALKLIYDSRLKSFGVADDLRNAVAKDLDAIFKLCHQCGSRVAELLRKYRGEAASE